MHDQWPKRTGPAGNGQPIIDDHARYACAFDDIRGKDLQSFACNLAIATGHGIEGAYGPFDLFGTLAEIETRLGFCDLCGIGDTVAGLWHGCQSINRGEYVDNHSSTKKRQFFSQLPGIFMVDFNFFHGEHGAGIKAAVHLHDGDARARITGQHGALHRRGAAPAGKKRGMDVDTAMARRIEHRLRQDKAIGGDHRHVDAKRSEISLFGTALQAQWCFHRQAQRIGTPMHRAAAGGLAATGRAWRLAVDGDDIMPRRCQRIERRHREIGGSHKGYSHVHRVNAWQRMVQAHIEGIMASTEIDALTQALSRLPGFGPRSARRAVLHMLKRRETTLTPLLHALERVDKALATCSTCGNIDTVDPCTICSDHRRDARLLCVVEEVADLWALDRSRLFPGRFHVLGGRLSALDGVRPEDLSVEALIGRVAHGGFDEVVLAMNATLEGQTTAHYVAERLEQFPIRLTQLAHGLPVGGELDYLDEGTLAQALRARRPVS